MLRLTLMFLLLCALQIRVSHAEGIPGGELDARINMTFDRFYKVTEPAFTDAFILADVQLNPEYPRRFDEFSGDISGRFVGAVAMMSRGGEDDALLHRLVDEILKCQREDGRFGDAGLSFAAADVGPDQMALLWGNGRLLVGLLEYLQRFPERGEVLQAAGRLGDFLLAVFKDCATPEVMERVRGKAANGFICFTQFNEGLELLARATGKDTYRDAARQMEPLLEPRGVQHTHGYLTTLRGHMMIYETTKEPALLEAVESRFQDLLDSGSILVNGGLLEYFKPDYNRDEGCSEADFLRLCLQLWRATRKESYLAHAERCLYNSFYANQFETGDFGHRCFDDRGYVPHPGAGRAWWCCTMHGMRAFRDVMDTVIADKAGLPMDDGQPGIRIDLLEEGSWCANTFKVRIERMASEQGCASLAFRIIVESAPESFQTISVRIPNWADLTTKKVIADGTPVSTSTSEVTSSDKDEELVRLYGRATSHGRVWKAGDTMEIHLACPLRLQDRTGRVFEVEGLDATNPVEAALFVGPWLLGVDAGLNPMFHGEPYRDNLLFLPGAEGLSNAITFQDAGSPLAQGPRLTLTYRHGGFPDVYTVTLTPVSEQTPRIQTTVSYWHLVSRER